MIMNMNFSIRDRLLLKIDLPSAGSLAEMKSIKKLNKALTFTQDEIDEYEIKQTDNGFSWKPVDYYINIELDPIDLSVLKFIVDKWDEEKKINMQNIELAEMINEAVPE